MPFQGNYCLSGCSATYAGVPKCGGRADVACAFTGSDTPTSRTCDTYADCDATELCDRGYCAVPLLACVPTCGGDYACGPGRYCDFSSGLCSDSPPAGAPIGASCIPADDRDCDGFCGTDLDGSTGTCSASCTFNDAHTGCGWDGTGPADAACLFGTSLSDGPSKPGDVGVCGKLCDCNADCTNPGQYCLDNLALSISDIWHRGGYCGQLSGSESVADTIQACP